jgi:hypothetical protein
MVGYAGLIYFLLSNDYLLRREAAGSFVEVAVNAKSTFDGEMENGVGPIPLFYSATMHGCVRRVPGK